MNHWKTHETILLYLCIFMLVVCLLQGEWGVAGWCVVAIIQSLRVIKLKEHLEKLGVKFI